MGFHSLDEQFEFNGSVFIHC